MNDFIRNKEYVDEPTQKYLFFHTHAQLLKQAYFYVHFDQTKAYLEAQVWKKNFTYEAMPIKVITRLARRLNKNMIHIQYVEEFNRDQPVGPTYAYNIVDLPHLNTRVAWL